jgi:tellurite resistance protein
VFLSILTPPQQRVFLEAARAVVEQDGHIADVEQALIDGLHSECGLDETPTALRDVSAIAAEAADALDHGPVRRAFVLELAGVVLIDGHSHADEVAAVTEIARALDVADEHLDEMFAFAARAQALVVDGRRLIATQQEES